VRQATELIPSIQMLGNPSNLRVLGGHSAT
jgi:hypothetical protein